MPIKKIPQKRFYRQRAHCNPLSDSYIKYPLNSSYVDWSIHYPNYFQNNKKQNETSINGKEELDKKHVSERDKTNETYINGKEMTNPNAEKSVEQKGNVPNNLADSEEIKDTYYSVDVTTYSKEKKEITNKTSESERESEIVASLYLNTKKYPISYDRIVNTKNTFHKVEILDIGCGYGGLLFALSKIFEDKLILGMEIRDKITNYVGEKIHAYRINHYPHYNNISIIRTNVIKFLPNYIDKNQIEKIFFCFPDPHFKKHNWRRRIITLENLSLYYHVLKKNGLIYFITDVYTLYLWVKNCFEKYPHFEILPHQEYANDISVKLIQESSEESKKVKRNNQQMYYCVVKKI